ncbi:MAG: hypothetical protein IJ802_03675 [Kiritimatiellae bacterium]|nr:hypothetical protein [Kiritimatiellia bacterium]
MKCTIPAFALAAACLAAGCFTTGKTEFPFATIANVANAPSVKVEGFAATLTDYIPVTTTTTAFGGDAWGGGRRHRHRHGYGSDIRTYNSVTYVPDIHSTDAYRDRAVALLEQCGFVTRAPAAQYTLRCDFGELEQTQGLWKRRLLYCGTLFMADCEARAMSAELRIYENATGRLVHSETLVQEYAASGWSLIPFFGMQDHEPTQGVFIRHFCRSALADKAVEAAAAFFRR